MKRKLPWGIVAAAAVVFLFDRYFDAGRFAPNIRAALERALHRKVGIGRVSLTWLHGPGFAVSDVVIHEDPLLGAEPIAYVTSMEIRPRVISLLGGRFDIASLRLEEPSLNLAKNSAGPWNLQLFLGKTRASATLPEIQVRGGRLNFRLSDIKSAFYFTNADLDVIPSEETPGAYSVRFSGEPARTDRPAQGLGNLTGRGYFEPGGGEGRVTLSMDLEKSPIADLTVLTIGRDFGVHGLVTARARLTGTSSKLDVTGRLEVGDFHRWDLMAARGDSWPLDFQGVVDLQAQLVDVRTVPGKKGPSLVNLHFRMTDFLTQPHWGLIATADALSLDSLAATLRHTGVNLPEGVKGTGTLAAVVGYSSRHGLKGAAQIRDVSLSAPDLPGMRVERYGLTVEGEALRLMPATIRIGESRALLVEGEFHLSSRTHNLKFVTPLMGIGETMKLRAVLGITDTPLLSQCRQGSWRGTLTHHADAEGKGEWNGSLTIQDAEIPLPQFAGPLKVAAAALRIQPGRTTLERVRGTLLGIPWRGEYRWEQGATRPHRFRIAAAEVSLAQLEKALSPALLRSQGLLARTLGLVRSELPTWLRDLRAEGTVSADVLTAGENRLEKFRAELIWEASRVDLRAAEILAGGAKLEFDGAVDLDRPAAFTGRFRAGSPPLFEDMEVGEIAGEFSLLFRREKPSLRLRAIEMTCGEEVWRGEGGTRPDGTLRVELKSAKRSLLVTGMLDPFRVEAR